MDFQFSKVGEAKRGGGFSFFKSRAGCSSLPYPSSPTIAKSRKIPIWGPRDDHCIQVHVIMSSVIKRAASSEFGIYRLCEQRRFRRARASAQFARTSAARSYKQ